MGSQPTDDSVHVRDLVDVVLDSWTEPLVAAVERVGDDSLLLEAPRDRSGRVVLPEVGESGLLVWRGSRDLQQAPVSVVETTRRPGAQWLLRLTGRQSVCQRRSFVRADVQLAVQIEVEGVAREVTALDVSEGGLRCTTRDRDGLTGGAVVDVHLEVDDLAIDVRAEVVRARRPDPERPLDLGLRFVDLSIKDADRLRRWIFTELRRVRANAG